MAVPDKTDALVSPINPKRRNIMKVAATITGGNAVASIDPLVRAGAWTAGSDAPEKTELKVGFILLTDCASVVMASMLGLDKKYGIRVTPSKEASWADVRDEFMPGGLDTAHVLYGLVYGVQLGIGDPKKDMVVPMALNNSDQAITLSSKLKGTGVKDEASLKAIVMKDKRGYVFTQTSPTGTHAMWLYYWLAVHGIHPLQDARVTTVPPPQMVANMRVGNIDGYCVGEPQNARAAVDNIDLTVETTQATWKDCPEKTLGTTAGFVQKYPNTVRVLTAAVLETSKSIDASASNRRRTAKTIAAKSCVNTDMDIILDCILGRYADGLGKTWGDPDPMRFYHNGAVNFPYLLDGMQFLMQHKRWSLLKAHPNYLAVAKQVSRVDIFKQAAITTGTSLPKSDVHTTKLTGGVVWDAKNPAAYAGGLKLRA